MSKGGLGILHGAKTLLLQTNGGQVAPPHSVAAGLDYPAVGPEHCWLQSTGRAHYVGVDDDAAVDALHELAQTEGILCALETAHAVAAAFDWAKDNQGKSIVVDSLVVAIRICRNWHGSWTAAQLIENKSRKTLECRELRIHLNL